MDAFLETTANFEKNMRLFVCVCRIKNLTHSLHVAAAPVGGVCEQLPGDCVASQIPA